MTTLHEIRYGFEQIVLPGLFHKTTYNFFSSIFNDPDRIYDIFNDLCKSQRFRNPYSKTQFSSNLVKINPNVIAYQINFPSPQEPPLCYKAYLVIDSDCRNLQYYTAEKGAGGDVFLCGRGADGVHYNYGTVPHIGDAIDKIRKINNH